MCDNKKALVWSLASSHLILRDTDLLLGGMAVEVQYPLCNCRRSVLRENVGGPSAVETMSVTPKTGSKKYACGSQLNFGVF